MIEVYKILTLMYDGEVVPTLHKSTYTKTRGNSLKLKTERSRYDSRKYSFTPRVVNMWNSLPDSVVCAISVNAFKNKLDQYWANQDVVYDYEADIVGSSLQ